MPSHNKRRTNRKNRRGAFFSLGLVALGTAALVIGCRSLPNQPEAGSPPAGTAQTAPATPPPQTTPPTPGPSQPPSGTGETGTKPNRQADGKAVRVASNPTEITVLVNKSIALPDGYVPPDLVEPNVAFIFAEKHEKRLMRAEAARALEEMFAAAKADSIYLAGVSGYRSYETQEWLFNYYVQTQGEETARRYSAEPGHSEHQTGLTMDVSGSTGECAADDCFAGTPEAEWLAKHAHEHGFIIRYPKGKESITGYAYEPWHVRYVGKAMAAEIAAKGLTLEEHLGQEL